MTEQSTIADGMVVTVHYTLKNEEGDLLDTSEGDEPLTYLHGAENIVPGLEKELTGHGTGDKLQAKVPPGDGYGERSGPEPQAIPRARFPEDAELEAGMQILATGQSGETYPLWIVGVDDDNVLIDHNHPLAGVTLCFDVEVVEVRSATEEELQHGHPHGPDGHHHH